MKQRDIISLVLIALLVVIALLLSYQAHQDRLQDHRHQPRLEFVLGLDLRGGVQALLEVPQDYQGEVDQQKLQDAQQNPGEPHERAGR
jgi:preprotein translocase subunit SecD